MQPARKPERRTPNNLPHSEETRWHGRRKLQSRQLRKSDVGARVPKEALRELARTQNAAIKTRIAKGLTGEQAKKELAKQFVTWTAPFEKPGVRGRLTQDLYSRKMSWTSTRRKTTKDRRKTE